MCKQRKHLTLCNYCLVALCAFARLRVFHFTFDFFPCVYLCLPPSSGFRARLLLVHRSSFTCSHLLLSSSHGFLTIFDNSKLALFIKFCITQLVRWFACLSCRLGSTMILSEPLALWIFILIYAPSLLVGLFLPDVLRFRDFK
jgi:hypothetical protein